MMSAVGLELPLSLVKNASGALDNAWVGRLAQALGLRAFIETGTYLGESLENVCGSFERAVSIELSTDLHEAARRKFADRPNVTLLLGDSAHRIVHAAEICAGLPTMYWLDAHWSAGVTARSNENTPILTELALIGERASADDVVLIDDMRQFISLPEGFARHDANDGYPLIDEVLRVLARFPAGGFEAVLSGDILVCLSRERMKLLRVSPVVSAITALRTDPRMSAEQRRSYEQQIAHARGPERDVLFALPKQYEQSLQYGIGGDFCYWRALVNEAEWDLDAARADLEIARRCNVHVPPRPWEGQGASARIKRVAARLLGATREKSRDADARRADGSSGAGR
jgi:hypothetical protein